MCKVEKKDDFIGRTFPTPAGGVLTVVGISTSSRVDGHKKYLCECSICSKDTELFPDLFESVKRGLTGSKSRKPRVICGCTKFKWNEKQHRILVAREADRRGYVFNGWCGIFNGAKTKLNLHNPVSGNHWSTTHINNFYNGNGDPLLKGVAISASKLIPKEQRESEIRVICEEEGLSFLDWGTEVYSGGSTKFRWLCNKGHLCLNTSVDNFISGRRCITCRFLSGNMNGYYKERVDEQDFLYLFDCITSTKVGRSFDILRRQGEVSKPRFLGFKPEVLQTYTATHQVVYDTEQAIHAELRERGFQYDCLWTNECFTKDCWYVLQEILEDYVSSGILEKVT